MTDDVERRLQRCLRMTEALLDAMDAAVRSNPADVWKFASYRTFMRKSNDIVAMTQAIEPIDAPVDFFDMEKVPSLGSTVAIQQQDLFETTRASLQILKAYLTNRVNPKEERVVGIADFLQANLRRAMLHKPERERDVQDAIEQLLIGRGLEKGIDYDREVGRVKVSTKEVIPDFILPPLEEKVSTMVHTYVGWTAGRAGGGDADVGARWRQRLSSACPTPSRRPSRCHTASSPCFLTRPTWTSPAALNGSWPWFWQPKDDSNEERACRHSAHSPAMPRDELWPAPA